MSTVINTSGEYLSKKTGAPVEYQYKYISFDSLDEAVEMLEEAQVLKLVKRMTKVDASNTAREAAKAANGDSTRHVMSEEDKAKAKASRAVDKAILNKIKAMPREEREALGF